MRAWRVLDVACQRYQCEDKFTIEQLIDALQQGERLIAEDEHAPGAEQIRRRDVKRRKSSKKAAKLARSLSMAGGTPAGAGYLRTGNGAHNSPIPVVTAPTQA